MAQSPYVTVRKWGTLPEVPQGKLRPAKHLGNRQLPTSKLVGLSVDSRFSRISIAGGFGRFKRTICGQSPRLQGQLTGGPSVPRLLPETDVDGFASDVLRRVVVGMEFVATLPARKGVTVAVLRKRGSTPRTPLRSVRWVDLHDFNTAFFGFVFDVREQAARSRRIRVISSFSVSLSSDSPSELSAAMRLPTWGALLLRRVRTSMQIDYPIRLS